MNNQYISTQNAPRRELFAAANSGQGFRSFYQEVFGAPSIERRYLIKGGPGCGKSSFMKRIAAICEERGIAVEYYRCSSDPDSIDGIIAGGKVALFDATAPHVFDPQIAGAKDEIVDLGLFWNSDALFEFRDRISELIEQKRRDYSGAYRFLEAALSVSKGSDELVLPLVKRGKLEGAAARILRDLPNGEGYSYRIGIGSSVGMKGRCRLDYYTSAAKKVIAVEDYMGVGGLFIAAVANEAVRKHCAICVSYDPIDLTSPDAVLFEESGTSFVLVGSEKEKNSYSGYEKTVRCKRFVDVSACGIREWNYIKREHKSARRIYDSLCECASECMQRAGEKHFELEKIYGAAMDFEALGRFCKSFGEKIFDFIAGRSTQ